MHWRTDAWPAFDEIENAHKAVGGTKPCSRFVTRQLSYAYTMLLAARFQGFARALHAQTADAMAARGAQRHLQRASAWEPDEQHGARTAQRTAQLDRG
jgi:hypothetical protein